MIKETIKNRKNENVVIIVDEVENQKGLAFVMHGLGGCKEQPHIEIFANSFKEKGYTAIRFDTTNSFGESGGNYADASVTNYFEDLEDVIKWAENQKWYQEPFCLAGHSLGGISTILYAQKYPNKVKALAPISTVISGMLSMSTPKYEDHKEMKKRGWVKERQGIKLKWEHMEDRMKYDILNEVEKLTMPVLLIVGSLDDGTPLKHQKILFEKLPRRKELHIIEGAEHTFKEKEHLEEVREIFLKWIESLK
jgi:pimeloyl-ACP methyl ester carboxylesterase